MVDFITGPLFVISLVIFVVGMLARVFWYVNGLDSRLERVGAALEGVHRGVGSGLGCDAFGDGEEPGGGSLAEVGVEVGHPAVLTTVAVWTRRRRVRRSRQTFGGPTNS